jgi:hypothetical protein
MSCSDEPGHWGITWLAVDHSRFTSSDSLGGRDERGAIAVVVTIMSSSSAPPGAGTPMPPRRCPTILPAMPLAEALATTRFPCAASRTGERTALVTARPLRAPHHPILDAGLIGGGHVPMPGEVSLAHHGCSSWMNGRRAAATSWRSGGNRSRMVFSTYNLPHILNLHTLAELARRVMKGRESGSAR